MLESLGYEVFDVEVQFQGHQTRDLLGFIDLLGYRVGETVGLQVTSANGGNVSARTKNCLNETNAIAACLRANWKIEVWGVRDVPIANGSFAATRHFLLETDADGEHVTAYEGSQILIS